MVSISLSKGKITIITVVLFCPFVSESAKNTGCVRFIFYSHSKTSVYFYRGIEVKNKCYLLGVGSRLFVKMEKMIETRTSIRIIKECDCNHRWFDANIPFDAVHSKFYQPMDDVIYQ